jgi:hypothetical protein
VCGRPGLCARCGRGRSSSSAILTPKNSSRFDEAIAQNLARVEQGHAWVGGQLEHAPVEVDPGELSVQKVTQSPGRDSGSGIRPLGVEARGPPL